MLSTTTPALAVTAPVNVAASESLMTKGKVLSVTFRKTKPALVIPACPAPI